MAINKDFIIPDAGLQVNGAAVISSSLGVNGAVTIANTLTVNGSLTVANTIAVGNTTVTGNVNVSVAANVGGAIRAGGLITGAAGADITGTSNASVAINVGANVNLSVSAINVGNSSSNTVVTQTSVNTGNSTLFTTIGQATGLFGNSTVNTFITNSAIRTGNATSYTNVTATALTTNGTLTVTGATTLSNTLAVTGNATFSNNVTVTANVTAAIFVGPTVTSAANLDLNPADAVRVVGGGSLTVANTLSVNGAATFSNNVTVAGNFTVSGTTTFVNTATLNVADNIIALNTDVAGAPSENAGVEVNRGTSSNVSLIWNESTDRWQISSNTSTFGNIHSTLADVVLGTDTSGNYVATISNGNGLSGSGTGEGSTPTLAVVANNGIVANATGVFVNGNNGITVNAGGVFADGANGISVDASGINVLAGTELTSNATGVHHNDITRTNTTTGNTSPNYAGTFTAVDSVTTNARGHVTGVNTKTVTMPSSNNTTYDMLAVANTTASNAILRLTDSSSSNDSVFFVGTDEVVTSSNATHIIIDHADVTRSDATSSVSPASGGTLTAVDSVTTNARGHVTAINVKTVTLPIDPNTTYDLLAVANTNASNAMLRLQNSSNANDTVFFVGTDEVVTSSNATHIIIDHADVTRSDATSTASPNYAGTFTAVDSVTTNARGHVTGINVKTVTMPSSNNTTYDLLAVANTAVNAGILRLQDSANANDNVTFTGAGTSNVSSNATHIIITSADQYVGTVTSVLGGAGLTGNVTTSGSLEVGTGNGIAVDADSIRVVAGTGVTSNATGVHIGQDVGNTASPLFGPRVTLRFANTSTGGIPTLSSEAANGTSVSPTQTTSGASIFRISPTAYTGSAYTGVGSIEVVATENITSLARGSKWDFTAISAGQAIGTVMSWNGDNLTLNTVNVATQTFSSNATNLTSGTIPLGRFPSQIVNTSASFTLSGAITFGGGIVLGTTSLSANGGVGTAGQVLHSNGSAAYWGADDNTAYDMLAVANTTASNAILRLSDSSSSNDSVFFVGTDEVVTSSNATHIIIDHADVARSDTTSALSPNYAGTFTAVDGVTTNARGHVTAINVKTVTMPSSNNTTYDLATAANTVANEGLVNLTGSNSTTDTGKIIGLDEITISSNATAIYVDHNDIARSNTTSTASPASGGTFTAVDSVTTNARGHVTALNLKTVTLPIDPDTTYDLLAVANTTASNAILRLTNSSNANDTIFFVGTDEVVTSSNATHVVIDHADVARSNTTSSASPTSGGTFTAVDSVTTNARGHITALNLKTVTLPVDPNTTYTGANGVVLTGTEFRANVGGTLVANASGIHMPTVATAGASSSGISAITIDAQGRVTSVTGSAGYVTSSGVTSVATSNGLTGGTITTTGTLSVLANNGIVANSTGVFVNAGGAIVANSTGVHHQDTSSQASVDNSGQTFIQDITLDTYGHITGITSATATGSITAYAAAKFYTVYDPGSTYVPGTFTGYTAGLKNVSSVTINTFGNYTFNFTTAFSDANYKVAVTPGVSTNTATTAMMSVVTQANGSVRVLAKYTGNSSGGQFSIDPSSYIHLIALEF